MTANYWSFWAKTDRRDSDSGPLWHPLACHGLDVAACGQVLLEELPALRRRIGALSGLPEEALLQWLTFLLSIHDIGKAADSFQGLNPELFQQQGREHPRMPYREYHDLLGSRWWEESFLARGKPVPDLFARASVEGSSEDWRELCKPWLNAIMGHHGEPPRQRNAAPLNQLFPPAVLTALGQMVSDLSALLLPCGVPFRLEPLDAQLHAFQLASWPSAGLAVMADWLGSNDDFFPYAPEASQQQVPLAEYWRQVALPAARKAVAHSGLLPSRASTVGGLRELFDHQSATPLQEFAENVPLAAGPQLWTLEEATGGGKTEAALILAHRLMTAGLAHGVFFALPTMATANAMYGRVTQVFPRLFEEDATASLVLAHSKRHLFLGMEETRQEARAEHTYGAEEPTASQVCTAWLADNRKKALLAAIGVGTIDQALMGILPLRHQSLRLAGLVEKVLLVDEVHACDDYVSRLLENLLTHHATMGGSAILLSATLPISLRRKLTEAFQRGLTLGGYGEGAPFADSDGYPLATGVAANFSAVREMGSRKESRRRVRTRALRSSAEVEEFLDAALTQGRCACWIRNTVADAQEAYERACQRYGRDRVTLFHSRFTVGDRADLEAEILDRFGPESSPEARAGQLLIATQVVEQSLDLDFDCMATDLCPIDLVLQRAGRLLRHRRDGHGRRLPEGATEPDGRGEAVLGILSPEPHPQANEEWYRRLFERGAYVYPHHDRLWLTAQWLEERGGFRVPEECRELIEYVYGEGAGKRVPKGLQEVESKAEGESRADRYLATSNALRVEAGYATAEARWNPEEGGRTPTRLGEPTVVLRLVRRNGDGAWRPWYTPEGGMEHFAWALSEVSCREQLAAEEDFPPEDPTALELRASMPDRGRYCKLVCLGPDSEGEERWLGTARSSSGEQVQIRYSPRRGLEISG